MKNIIILCFKSLFYNFSRFLCLNLNEKWNEKSDLALHLLIQHFRGFPPFFKSADISKTIADDIEFFNIGKSEDILSVLKQFSVSNEALLHCGDFKSKELLHGKDRWELLVFEGALAKKNASDYVRNWQSLKSVAVPVLPLKAYGVFKKQGADRPFVLLQISRNYELVCRVLENPSAFISGKERQDKFFRKLQSLYSDYLRLFEEKGLSVDEADFSDVFVSVPEMNSPENRLIFLFKKLHKISMSIFHP